LTGAEASLFREGLSVVVDCARQDEEGSIWKLNVAPFDTLQYGQKLAVLAQVGSDLFREDEPAPKLTAVLEGTVAVVYALVWDMLQLEIDDPEARRASTDLKEADTGRLPRARSCGRAEGSAASAYGLVPLWDTCTAISRHPSVGALGI
jgi:hypothetical protein